MQGLLLHIIAKRALSRGGTTIDSHHADRSSARQRGPLRGDAARARSAQRLPCRPDRALAPGTALLTLTWIIETRECPAHDLSGSANARAPRAQPEPLAHSPSRKGRASRLRVVTRPINCRPKRSRGARRSCAPHHHHKLPLERRPPPQLFQQLGELPSQHLLVHLGQLAADGGGAVSQLG